MVKKEYETDVLIIGSGIAGTSVAIELQKKNIKTIKYYLITRLLD